MSKSCLEIRVQSNYMLMVRVFFFVRVLVIDFIFVWGINDCLVVVNIVVSEDVTKDVIA